MQVRVLHQARRCCQDRDELNPSHRPRARRSPPTCTACARCRSFRGRGARHCRGAGYRSGQRPRHRSAEPRADRARSDCRSPPSVRRRTGTRRAPPPPGHNDWPRGVGRRSAWHVAGGWGGGACCLVGVRAANTGAPRRSRRHRGPDGNRARRPGSRQRGPRRARCRVSGRPPAQPNRGVSRAAPAGTTEAAVATRTSGRPRSRSGSVRTRRRHRPHRAGAAGLHDGGHRRRRPELLKRASSRAARRRIAGQDGFRSRRRPDRRRAAGMDAHQDVVRGADAGVRSPSRRGRRGRSGRCSSPCGARCSPGGARESHAGSRAAHALRQHATD